MKKTDKNIVIIGGGAAGFFAAITAAEDNPECHVTILEKGISVLGKVKVSGGGRCNVTNTCSDPGELIKYYPRGGKALLGPFYKFSSSDTIQWFEQRGVKLKAEQDGRMFPVTDNSQTIVDCFLRSAKNSGVELLTGTSVTALHKLPKSKWVVVTKEKEFNADSVIVCSGSSGEVWKLLKEAGHKM